MRHLLRISTCIYSEQVWTHLNFPLNWLKKQLYGLHQELINNLGHESFKRGKKVEKLSNQAYFYFIPATRLCSFSRQPIYLLWSHKLLLPSPFTTSLETMVDPTINMNIHFLDRIMQPRSKDLPTALLNDLLLPLSDPTSADVTVRRLFHMCTTISSSAVAWRALSLPGQT